MFEVKKMADSGRWFKLWCASVNDPDLSNLDIADFGRWAKLGAYIKEHGTDGSVTLKEPSKMIIAMLQLPSLKDIALCFERMRNVTVSLETNSIVSYTIKYENWHKYQGDFSTQRVRKFRAKKTNMKRSKRRGEEKRGEETRKEEKRETTNTSFIDKIKENPAYKEIDIDRELSKMDAWLSTPAGKGRRKTARFVVNWLNRIDTTIKTDNKPETFEDMVIK